VDTPVFVGHAEISTTVGIDYARENVHFQLKSVNAPGSDSLTTLTNVVEDDAAAYAQIIVTPIAPLSITGGLRGEYFHIPYRDRLVSATMGPITFNNYHRDRGHLPIHRRPQGLRGL